jgi:hypothetical protein
VAATLTWDEGVAPRTVRADDIARVWSEIAESVVEPVIVLIDAEGAQIGAVVGDPVGTSLVYFPPGYADTGIGSLHSVGDLRAAQRDQWEPPQTAYLFTHHTELPRWSVVANEVGQRALRQFCENPSQPPSAVSWELD